MVVGLTKDGWWARGGACPSPLWEMALRPRVLRPPLPEALTAVVVRQPFGINEVC